jgi:hypothetical protein
MPLLSEEPQRIDTTPGQTPWVIRPYQPGDEAQVVRLFSEVFGKPLTEARYRWKVLESPWPIGAPTVWLADAGGQICGQYAGTPMRFRLCGAEQTILHVCDVMTAASFRRQGILTTLGQAAHQAWAPAGVPFVTGLHYGGWGTRRHYLGWREQFKAAWVWRPLRPARLLARRMPLPAPALRAAAAAGWFWNALWDRALAIMARNVEACPIEQPGPEFDALWEALNVRYEALVVRDRAWVAYRYAAAPGFGYRLLLARRGAAPVGYLAYRLTARDGRATGWIADLFTAPEDAPARAGLLRQALNSLRAAGADDVRALVSQGTALHSAFRQAGFLAGPGAFDVSIVPLAPGLPLEVLRDPNRWFTTGGDFDVV